MKSRKQKTLTEREKVMLEEGFVSIRMAHKKTLMHKTSLARLARSGDVESREIGGAHFLNIESLKKHMGPDAVETFGLNNWTDIEFE